MQAPDHLPQDQRYKMRKTGIFLIFALSAGFTSGAFATTYITSDITNGCTGDRSFTAVFEPSQYTCAAGYYLPADGIACIACPAGTTCPGGTFTYNPTAAQGITITGTISTNITGICKDTSYTFKPVFQIKQYTCSSGYYLPAGQNWLTNNDGCTACPNGSYCAGGTFTYNETTDQGIVANSCPTGHSPNANDPTVCDPNVITIIWEGADQSAITANNAGTTVYGGDIRTPTQAQHVPGKTFQYWRFVTE